MTALFRPILPYSALLIGALVVAYTACSTPAYADDGAEPVLPAGTVCQLPRDGERVALPDLRFAVTRTTVDTCNAAHEMNRRLTRDLLACSGTLAERTKPEPGWRVAGKWALWGISVGAAFALGATL
jgi:hypothetical protein